MAWAAGPTVAYFSMEIALDDAVPTYSGGLGVLAGDHVRAAADAGLPLVAVTLLYRQGYFEQRLSAEGDQREAPERWAPEERLEPVPVEVTVELAGAPVRIGAWRYTVVGARGHEVPVYLLDTDRPGNPPETAALTASLYAGDDAYRLAQEIVLGMGGVALLDALGLAGARTYHMNEGHSALLALALLRDAGPDARLEAVRRRCVFTTHTPVPAGHDRFPSALVEQLLGADGLGQLEALGAIRDGRLDMTLLGIGSSHFINGVSQRHGEVTRAMFPEARISSITNGVHAAFWAAPPMAELFDAYLPGWREDATSLRQARVIPLAEMRGAHDGAKRMLLDEVERRTGRALDPEALTLGFARRATPYKRMRLLFSDPDRLAALAREAGPLQVVLAGKAHPRDDAGKADIRAVFARASLLAGAVEVVYLEDYSMAMARLLCSGADVWLNTPRRPHEASGTSGMKAAVNAVPSLSVLDGWWVEGHIEGVTGWAVGQAWAAHDAAPGTSHVATGGDEAADDASGHGGNPTSRQGDEDAADASDLYQVLREKVLPLYYTDPEAFAAVGRDAVALNGSYFTTQRMLADYCRLAYDADV